MGRSRSECWGHLFRIGSGSTRACTQTYEIEVNVGAVDALASNEAEIDVWLEA